MKEELFLKARDHFSGKHGEHPVRLTRAGKANTGYLRSPIRKKTSHSVRMACAPKP
jgi:hypothetical protein